MDFGLPQRLQDYIDAELNYEALYRAMSNIAPNEEEQRLFLEIADNERQHANAFGNVYTTVTGQSYNPQVYPASTTGPYQFALRQLILNEHRSFKEYHRQFMKTDNMALKNACYQVGRNKSDHISKLMGLMTD